MRRKITMREYYLCRCDLKCGECIYCSRLTGTLYYCNIFGFVLSRSKKEG